MSMGIRNDFEPEYSTHFGGLSIAKLDLQLQVDIA